MSPPQAMRSLLRSLAPLSIALSLLAPAAGAQGIPSPFGEPDTTRPPARKPERPAATPPQPMYGGTVERSPLPPVGPGTVADGPVSREALPAGPIDENARTVMRDELAPVMAADGSGLPHELWRGLTVDGIEKLFAALEIPPRSPALHGLFRRLITSDVALPAAGTMDPRFTALRIEALDRSGLVDEAAALLAKEPAVASDPVISLLSARTAIARGDREGGCANIAAMNAAPSSLPAGLRDQSILIRGYCSLVAGRRESAQLQVALARDEGVEASAGLDALDAIAAGVSPALAKGQKVGSVDWRILELSGAVDAAALIESAGPGLLAILSRDPATDPALRLAAAEGAAKLNAIAPADLATAYRTFQGSDGPAGAEGPGQAAVRHAALFQSAEDERTPLKKARLIRSFLDDARRNGLYWPALQMIAPSAAAIQRIPEIGWFAETAIETALASGDFNAARSWAEFATSMDDPGAAGRNGFAHWLALADIADPVMVESRARHLGALEVMAARGRFDADQLHRLATVLDALDIQVPIPLWEIASRAPQPAAGFLPETGVLSALAEAAKKSEFGHTVLLAMRSLGPSGAEGAHIISLGDSIRALRRAGLESDARKLALEALFAGWPRAVGT